MRSSSSGGSSGSLSLLTRLLPASKHCFVALPAGTFVQQLRNRDAASAQGCMVIALEWTESTAASTLAAASSSAAPVVRRVYVGWLGEYLPNDASDSAGMGAIGLPLLFAQSMHIPANLRVQLTLLADTASASASQSMVVLEPLTPDDWEILELNPGAVEMGLMAQVQVLNPSQSFPLQVGGAIVKLKHSSTGSDAFRKLTLHSEVSVVPKPRPSRRNAAVASSAAPSGPPPPVIRVRVQPQPSRLVRQEVRRRTERVGEWVAERKDRALDQRVREWEASQSAAASDFASVSGIDFARTMPSMNAAAAPVTPSCTLLSPHYIHVAPATLRSLQCVADELVVVSYRRRIPPTLPPLPPAPAGTESVTCVVRIAAAESVFTDDGSAAQYVLLPRSLRLSLRASDWDWIHVQKLTAHSAVPPAQANSVRASLCARESTQRISAIRLREVIISKRGAESTRKPLSDAASTPAAQRLQQRQAEDDARAVSEAFIRYVKDSHSSNLDDVSTAAAPLPVPFINGGIVSLEVADAEPATLRGSFAPSSSQRFFSVHFNDPDLIATLSAANRRPDAAPLSMLDTSELPDEKSTVAGAGGLKVSMAASYLLLAAPTAPAEPAAKGKKPKKGSSAPLQPPLPTPLLHAVKQTIEVEPDEFESDELDATAASGDASVQSPRPRFDELASAPDFRKTVVDPLLRFLKSTLCADYIAQRGSVLRGENDAPLVSAHAGGLMLTGASGAGKTALLHSVCRLLRERNDEVGVLASTVWIDAPSCLGMKVREFREFLRGTLSRVAQASPGAVVLVMDDIDKLLPASGENDAAAGLRASQLTEVLVDAFADFHSTHPDAPVTLLASSLTASSHHASLLHLFPHVIAVPNPTPADRVDIVQTLLRRNGAAAARGVEWGSVGRKSEGFTPADLTQLVQRATHAAVTRGIQTQIAPAPVTPSSDALVLRSDSLSDALSLPAHQPLSRLQLQPADFDAAFQGFVPSALKELSMAGGGGAGESKSDEGWETIGGLFQLKRTLLDTFELPTRYAALFAQAPLKLRSGLLLYGPSGCGKTLIASHIAARCGLNFLSVKGPELLNKYIGSSEAAVRDVFARARNAAPALLFFDEMESITPARGGDSTGVTDRVVNQFLCELDGVEGKLAGGKAVYVLGASSRPDLIDPALLRPGRLDKSLYCGLPDREERVDMLRRMIRSLVCEADMDVEVIAAQTGQYTPADLQAIVTNAQMMIVQEVIAKAQEQIDEAKANHSKAALAASVLPPLTQAHLLAAFESSKPSTSEQDRARYAKVYDKFRLNREDPMDQQEFDPKKQRQAMA